MARLPLKLLVIFCLFLYCFNFASAQQKSTNDDNTLLHVQVDGSKAEDLLWLRLRTQLVTVPLTVTDHKNHYITNLKVEDLKLFENEKEQEIVSLEKVLTDFIAVTIVMDFSGSMGNKLYTAKQTTIQFLEKILHSTNAQGALIAFQQEVVLASSLTNDINLLRKAINNIDYNLPVPIGQAMPFEPRLETARTALGASLYVAIDDVLKQSKPGMHRIIVLISDGFDSENTITPTEIINEALRSNVTIYALGITNTNNGIPKDVNKKFLEQICENTGGKAFFPSTKDDTFSSLLTKIEEDLHGQYVLSYVPTSATSSAFRLIKVEFQKHQDFKITHRIGYYTGVPN